MNGEAPRWQPQAGLVVSALRAALGDALVGVYVHGSAALGGWSPASDLDMLATVDAREANWRQRGQNLLDSFAPSPYVELSVIHTSAADPAYPWPFLVHVDHSAHRVLLDDGSGDADLLMHYLVCRLRGTALVGPPPEVTFGRTPRRAVLTYLRDELAWALEHSDQRYAVLNACRALAYAYDDVVLSKADGGRWAMKYGFDRKLVSSALAAQAAGRGLGAPTPTAQLFVRQCMTRLTQRMSPGR